MKYKQLDTEERFEIAALRAAGHSMAEIGRRLGRAASTVSREVARNRYRTDGRYRAAHADRMSRGRRRRAHQGSRFSPEQWAEVDELLREQWSPEQVSGRLRGTGGTRISHETIYQRVWSEKKAGGDLWTHLRGARKRRRKRYGARDSRGRLAGKRPIGQRPAEVESRREVGHWEIDTIHGSGKASLLTMVERVSGYIQIGHLAERTAELTNRRMAILMRRLPDLQLTCTADNGPEFHGYAEIERQTTTLFYFATPHHAWERGTNENANGLLRQYFPKGTNLNNVTQRDCDRIAAILNNRPRKRHNFLTPVELLAELI